MNHAGARPKVKVDLHVKQAAGVTRGESSYEEQNGDVTCRSGFAMLMSRPQVHRRDEAVLGKEHL